MTLNHTQRQNRERKTNNMTITNFQPRIMQAQPFPHDNKLFKVNTKIIFLNEVGLGVEFR